MGDYSTVNNWIICASKLDSNIQTAFAYGEKFNNPYVMLSLQFVFQTFYTALVFWVLIYLRFLPITPIIF